MKEQIDNSTLNKKYLAVNIFISNDMSSNGIIEYLQDIYKNDERLVYLESNRLFIGADKNFFYRLIMGVNLSIFNYIYFSEQDDIWNYDKICRAISLLVKEKIDFYSSDITAFLKVLDYEN